MIVVVFLELCFFVEKQFFEPPTLCWIGGDFEHSPIMLNVLSYDKTFHDPLSKAATAPTLLLELDQCGFVYLR